MLQTLPAYGIVDAPPEPHPMSEVERAAGEEALREIAAEVLGATDGSARAPTFHVVGGMGNPALDVLDAAARLDADLIVMATHGRTGVRRFFLGSVAEKVVQLAPCPVFTVKAFEKSLLPSVDASGAAAPRADARFERETA